MNKSKIGVFVKCPHSEMIEAIGIAGFDFAVVDMEHTPLGPRELYPLVLAAENRQLELIVRIPFKQDAYFKWCRDLNISSIQVPHIETKEDVIYAMKHSYFNPMGERGLCRFVRAADFSGKTKDQYLEEANSKNKLILQIEGKTAFQNLDSILDVVTENTSLFIGPYDLSQSLGKPGKIWDDEVISTMNEIIIKCNKKNIAVGTFTDTVEGIKFWKDKGISYIQYASDLNLFIDKAKSIVAI